MKRRIYINLLINYIFLPFILILRDYIEIEILNTFDKYSGTFLDYINFRTLLMYLVLSTIFLLLILVPYNFIIFKQPKKPLLLKVLLFNFMIIIIISLWGLFSNIWYYPYWKNIYYLIYSLPLSISFVVMLHLFVDKRQGK